MNKRRTHYLSKNERILYADLKTFGLLKPTLWTCAVVPQQHVDIIIGLTIAGAVSQMAYDGGEEERRLLSTPPIRGLVDSRTTSAQGDWHGDGRGGLAGTDWFSCDTRAGRDDTIIIDEA